MNTQPPVNEEEIFQAAAALPPPERAAYLDALCGDSLALRVRLDRLLGSHDDSGFMQAPAEPHSPEVDAALARLKPEESGETIGPYKLREQIGEGGFGTVWVADQETPVRRRVALKIIKLGMDTREVIARFEQERQALAMMDHPNIAKVLDAGATQHGRPYFVMELVRGIKITDYCDQANLPTSERLQLFISVCHAVQHAHQKGIIHRDLKPSNILVTMHDGVPVPKVIDFGVAKATQSRLTDHTIYTQFQQMIGTPLYMSPEQAEMSGLDIDTRSDIYSLGVLLYELLTGRTPLAAETLLSLGLDEIRRIIREQEAPRPSNVLGTMAPDARTQVAQHRQTEPPKLIGFLRGDLDWIVMKALEKDRTRRYETVNGLASDIQRHLNSEPVLARPPSQLYRFQTLVRRNKLAFTAAAAVFASLFAGLGFSTWMFQRERAARKNAVTALAIAESAETEAKKRLAESEAARAEAAAISEYCVKIFQSPDPARDGRTITVAEMLDHAAGELATKLANQPSQKARLEETLGEVYNVLGLAPNAIPLLEDARSYFLASLGPEHRDTLVATCALALAYHTAGRWEEGLKLSEQALERCRHALGPENELTLAVMQDVATNYADAGRSREALEMRAHSLELNRKVYGSGHPRTLQAMGSLANSYDDAGRFEDALKMREEGLGLMRKALGPEHPDTLMAMSNLANSYRVAGRRDEALKMKEQVLDLRRKVLGPEHPDTLMTMSNLANSYEDDGRTEEALHLRQEVFELRRKTQGPEHPDTLRSMNNLASSYRSTGRRDDALAMREQALILHRKVFGPEHPNTPMAMNALAESYEDAGRKSEAGALREEAQAIKEKAPAHGRARPEDLDILRAAARRRARSGQWQEARADFASVLALNSGDHFDWYLLAPLLLQTGDVEAYRKHRREMLAKFAATTDLSAMERVSKASMLLPLEGDELETAGKLADTSATQGAEHQFRAYFQFNDGLADYRRRRFHDAIAMLRAALNDSEVVERNVQADAVLAMAYHRLGESAEASAALAKGAELAATLPPKAGDNDHGNQWHDVLMARMLLQEARALLAGPPGH